MTAQEIRERILKAVAANGGHLASSLGAVEIAMALSEEFEPSRDRIVWDVGHQAYAWKILTGRADKMDSLRTLGGISGFPSPAESVCDAAVGGHAGVALSIAEGYASARRLTGADYHVVAVTGDSSLVNGTSFEALNNCAAAGKVILVLNDNDMSISKPAGSFRRFLGSLIAGARYNRAKNFARKIGRALHLDFMYDVAHWFKGRIKSLFLADTFFEQFGFRYLGPVDGHDVAALRAALAVAKEERRSVIIHAVTKKGKGYKPAEDDPTAWHGVGPGKVCSLQFAVCSSEQEVCSSEQEVCSLQFAVCSSEKEVCSSSSADSSAREEDAPRQLQTANCKLQTLPQLQTANCKLQTANSSWSTVFGRALCDEARKDGRIVALTAGMKDGTGLTGFAAEFPASFFDVGIAEGHMVAFAAGLAAGGLKPVVAVYSTFLQRAVDQVMHDVCIANIPVVFCVDRAGVVGADGVTHQGIYDIAMLRCLPNLTICQPKDADDLAALLHEALERNGPTVIRYPRGSCPCSLRSPCLMPRASCLVAENTEALGTKNEARRERSERYAIWATGDWFGKAQEIADAVGGVAVHARYIKPFDAELLKAQREAGMKIVSLENGSIAGGLGEAIGADVKFGWPDEFIPHGTQEALEKKYRLDAASVVESLMV